MLSRPARTVARPRPAVALREAVPGEAAAPSPDRSATRRQFAAYRQARACLYREQCGCVFARCHWRGRKVTMQECVACLGGSPPPPAGEVAE